MRFSILPSSCGTAIGTGNTDRHGLIELRHQGGARNPVISPKFLPAACVPGDIHAINLSERTQAFRYRLEHELLDLLGPYRQHAFWSYDELPIREFYECAMMGFVARGWWQHLMLIIIDTSRVAKNALRWIFPCQKRLRGGNQFLPRSWQLALICFRRRYSRHNPCPNL